MGEHEKLRELVERAMEDLRRQTGDDRSAYYTQGLTNWIPDLCDGVLVLLAEIERLTKERDQWEGEARRWRQVAEMLQSTERTELRWLWLIETAARAYVDAYHDDWETCELERKAFFEAMDARASSHKSSPAAPSQPRKQKEQKP